MCRKDAQVLFAEQLIHAAQIVCLLAQISLVYNQAPVSNYLHCCITKPKLLPPIFLMDTPSVFCRKTHNWMDLKYTNAFVNNFWARQALE
jgi:hypothetical protein